jgi:hypothetical protein
MKKMTLALIATMTLLPVISFGQANPTPPAAWVAFQKAESVKRAAFNAQMKADMQAFLSENPEVKSYFAEMRAASQARIAAWKAQHQNRI